MNRTGIDHLMSRLRRRPRWIAAGFIVMVVLAAGGAMLLGRGQTAEVEADTVQTAIVRRGDLVISATGSGTLTAPEEDLGFTGSGEMTVTAVNVSAGDLVQKGDVLAEVDSQQAALDQEDANRAYAELTSISGQAAALRQVADAQANLQRTKGTLEYLISPEVMYWETEIANGKVEVEAAEAQLEQAPSDNTKAAVDKATAFLDFAEDKLEDALEVYYDEYVPTTFGIKEDLDVDTYNVPSDLEVTRARLAVGEAEETLQESRELYEAVMSGVIREDTTNESLLQIKQAQQRLNKAQTNLEGSRIVAPFDGTIMEVNVTGGDVVEMASSEATSSASQTGSTVVAADPIAALLLEAESTTSTSSSDEALSAEGVIVLADTSQPYLEVSWNESDWPLLKVGNPVEITFDDRADQVFTGTITQIDRELYTSFESATIRGEVSLDSPFAKLGLPVGASASVEAIADRAEGALLIPIAALHTTDSGMTMVFVLADGQVRLREVEAGLMSEMYAAITSGLEAGEVVTTGLVKAE